IQRNIHVTDPFEPGAYGPSLVGEGRSEAIHDLWNGAVPDRALVIVIYPAVAVQVLVFNVAGPDIACLHRAVGNLLLGLEEPQGREAKTLAQLAAYYLLPGIGP